ncbi:MAG: DUF309 domain-containing protein [Verrucomicrobiae bacterium]|nr:DUF309 domain-containing protein [Verrucomicrobiae bacterium]
MATHKTSKILASIAHLKHPRFDAHYLGYFECFNAQEYYEAHDVLEDLWLEQKSSRLYDFYKGLIQLAGAFVHLKNSKLSPAARLFLLARKNISRYPAETEGLDVPALISRIDEWVSVLERSEYRESPYNPKHPPRIAPKL